MVTPVFSDSLSFGMREALDNDCADEVVICCACLFETEEELEEIIQRYLEVYWVKHPEAAEATRKAFREGRILVPRAEECHAPIGTPSMPLYVNWEEWKFEVAAHAPDWKWGWCPSNCKVTQEQVLACESIQEVYRLFPQEKVTA